MAGLKRSMAAGLGLVFSLAAGGCLSSADLSERTSLAEQGLLKQKPGLFKSDEFARYYSYWPEAEVYHSAWQDRYYWQDGYGNWDAGTRLPLEYQVMIDEYEPLMIELFTARPYTEHQHVVAMHPHMDSIQDTSTVVVSVPTD